MRIAIVNDTLLAAEALRRAVSAMPGHSIAWIARDGAQAVKLCKEDTPELILMDLIMPVMDGIEATRRIMATAPCPILVVTATVDGNSSKVFEALGAGALDVVQTPALHGPGHSDGSGALKFKIEMLERRISAVRSRILESSSMPPFRAAPQATEKLVAIGASAGGPAALAAILSGLSSDFPAALIIVQHIDEQFVPPMVNWLSEQSKLPVRIAVQGDHCRPGIALMAGTNDHLCFTNSSILGYIAEPRACSYRPCIDVFFESVLRHWHGVVIGVLLSGMGRDGTAGLKKLRDSGSVTIAQDAASSAVYGMPKAAVELGAATKVLPVHSIANELTTLCSKSPYPKRYPV